MPNITNAAAGTSGMRCTPRASFSRHSICCSGGIGGEIYLPGSQASRLATTAKWWNPASRSHHCQVVDSRLHHSTVWRRWLRPSGDGLRPVGDGVATLGMVTAPWLECPATHAAPSRVPLTFVSLTKVQFGHRLVIDFCQLFGDLIAAENRVTCQRLDDR